MKQTRLGMSAAAGIVCLLTQHSTAAVVTFESVLLVPGSYRNGSDGSGNFTLDGATFKNNFTDWGGGFYSWYGFATSNITDNTTPGYGNQYSAFAGEGAGGSTNYSIGYFSTYDVVNFGAATNVTFSALTNMAGKGASFTNTTYAALAIRDGLNAKKFGGPSGNDADWFKLTIEGFAAGIPQGTVDFYLADFRFADNSKDYIVDDWRYVDFSSLGIVDELRFSMSSTDNDPIFGINTPSYFAMDNFLAVPEPSALLCSLAGLGLVLRRKR